MIQIVKAHADLGEENKNTTDTELELLTYTPNEKDEVDVKFAEKYNKCDMARKFKVSKIKFNMS